MTTIELTDDERHWIAVSLENSIASAERLERDGDLDDQLDAGLLLNRYRALQVKFPPPDAIHLT